MGVGGVDGSGCRLGCGCELCICGIGLEGVILGSTKKLETNILKQSHLAILFIDHW
jgi:hypothetical protein